MQKRKRIAGLLLCLFLSACGGGLPPMQLVVVISPTPDPNVIMITVTPKPDGQTPPTLPTSAPAVPTNTPPVVAPVTEPGITATFVPSPTLSAFPTETRAQLLIAQQDFQNGYMYWISTQKVIWVLITSRENPNAGEWRIYPDTYKDGEPEFDPNLTPPSEKLYQPRRGFGKLWRDTPGLRDALGWATTPEFALNTSYVYQAGGSIDASGKFVAGPGKHFLTNLSRQTFVFYESAEGAGRWEKIG